MQTSQQFIQNTQTNVPLPHSLLLIAHLQQVPLQYPPHPPPQHALLPPPHLAAEPTLHRLQQQLHLGPGSGRMQPEFEQPQHPLLKLRDLLRGDRTVHEGADQQRSDSPPGFDLMGQHEADQGMQLIVLLADCAPLDHPVQQADPAEQRLLAHPHLGTHLHEPVDHHHPHEPSHLHIATLRTDLETAVFTTHKRSYFGERWLQTALGGQQRLLWFGRRIAERFLLFWGHGEVISVVERRRLLMRRAVGRRWPRELKMLSPTGPPQPSLRNTPSQTA